MQSRAVRSIEHLLILSLILGHTNLLRSPEVGRARAGHGPTLKPPSTRGATSAWRANAHNPAAAQAAQQAAAGGSNRSTQHAQQTAQATSPASVDIDVDAADTSGCTPLAVAAAHGQLAAAKALLDAGAGLEVADKLLGYTPLLWAVSAGDYAMVDMLLAHGASPAARTRRQGNTALHLACRCAGIASTYAPASMHQQANPLAF